MLLLLLLAIGCYAGVFGYLLWAVLAQKPLAKSIVLGVLAIGLITHASMLYPKIITLYGLNLNIFNVISLTSLFMLAFYWLFCWYRPILVMGVLALPLALGGVMVGFGNAPYQPLNSLSPLLQGHILLSLAAYCVLFMAAVQAVMLRLQMRELKSQTIHRIWVQKLPALQSMEALLFDMITLGFVLLSFALGLGFVDTQDLLGQHLAHKTVFSVVSWLVFGALLFGHWRYGWRGLRAVNMTIYGVVLLGLAFIGTKFVLELVLHH